MIYSQNNEEQLIRAYFGSFKGVCLDLGANDGITFSNTRACIEGGWSGVMVEASPRAFQRLEKLYSDNPLVECINIMVGTENGLSILHESSEHIGKGDVALLSTAVPAEMDRWKNTDTVFTPTEMYCVDFDRLMTLANHQTFDLISIDIEGHDLSVLRQMDLDALACRMLIVEWNSKDKEQFDNYVLPFGFRLYSKNAENLIYVR